MELSINWSVISLSAKFMSINFLLFSPHQPLLAGNR